MEGKKQRKRDKICDKDKTVCRNKKKAREGGTGNRRRKKAISNSRRRIRRRWRKGQCCRRGNNSRGRRGKAKQKKTHSEGNEVRREATHKYITQEVTAF